MSSISSCSSSSSSSLISSLSFTPLSQPLSKTRGPKDKIAQLFATCAPRMLLNILHSEGYTRIKECRCIPQFSRKKDEPKGNPDARELIEKELPDLVSKKITKKEEPLTICSIASGAAFEDLVLLSKLKEEGFKDISWILVDPCYSQGTSELSKEEGGELLAQFKELAECISPGIKTQTLDSTTEILSSKLIGNPDVFLDFDDGLMGQKSVARYLELLEPLEKHIYSSSKHVFYLHSEKQLAGFSLDEQQQILMKVVNAKVTLSYISPDQETPEKRTLVDSTVKARKHTPDLMSFKYFLQQNDYDGLKFCLESGMDAEQRDSGNYTHLMIAAEHGWLNAIKALVEVGHANVNATGNSNLSALYYAISSDSAQATISYLFAHGANINHRDNFDRTALIVAVGQGNTRAIRTLVALGARIDYEDMYGYTALDAFEELLEQQPTGFNRQSRQEIRALLTPKPASPEPTLNLFQNSISKLKIV